MKKIKSISLLAALLLVGSCSTTNITSTWKAPGITMKQYNKIMVVGIIHEADRTIRERMEEHMVGDLKDLGYNAFSAYTEYGPKAFEGLTEDQANSKLAQSGIDAVITVVLLDKQKERYYVPDRVVFTPYYGYHNHFYGYYNSIYTRIGTPGYYEVTTRYFWESNFYDLRDNKLLYSVQTQSFDPSSTDELAHQYGLKIVQNMEKNKILQQQVIKTEKTM